MTLMCEVQRKENDQWVQIEFTDLRKGDHFRQNRGPGTPYGPEYIAQCDAYPVEGPANAGVEIRPVLPIREGEEADA